ncbi:MAG: hypothetical protein JWN81_822 [Solirubrobacterales bacterium]|jgi:hypothetical protein|nr:hypothetical protein [Solirubrobacterales bacterium]
MRICRITVPGLSIRRDFEAARLRLLEDFPNVQEVVATTAPATLLVLYSGADEVDGWLDSLLDSVATGHDGVRILPSLRDRRRGGADSAA